MKALVLATAVLSAPLLAQAPAARPHVIDLTMTEDGYAPHRIVLTRGAPYVLRITNRTSTGHNLNQDAFFADAGVPDSTISVAAHDTATVRFTAPMGRPGARYRFSSTVLGDAGDKYRGWFVLR